MVVRLPIVVLLLMLACGHSRERKAYDLARITSPQGEIIILLHDQTPRHKASFIKLAQSGYFDSLTFNRVIDNFVAQGGCPDTPEGFAGSPYLLDPEFVPELRHIYGAVGAGRDNNPQMRSAGCQFYIVQNREGLHRLDDKYTVFGQVIKGMDVVDRIVKLPTDSLDAPLQPVTMKISVFKLDSAEIENLSRE